MLKRQNVNKDTVTIPSLNWHVFRESLSPSRDTEDIFVLRYRPDKCRRSDGQLIKGVPSYWVCAAGDLAASVLSDGTVSGLGSTRFESLVRETVHNFEHFASARKLERSQLQLLR